MHPVLRTDLAWKEESWDDSSHFVGKKVVECVVHQDEETCSETVWIVMTLANQNGDKEVVKLSASSCMDLPDHYIIHAFLSDPKSGYVVNEFPLDRTILGVTWASREEEGRSWSCTGYSVHDGCHISGLKFVLQGKPNESNSELHVILHCWSSVNLCLSAVILTVPATVVSGWQDSETHLARKGALFCLQTF